MLYDISLPLLWNGYTIGKRVVGIRIAPVACKKLTLLTLVIREFFVKTILYGAGFGVLSLISIYLISTRADKRSIHDLLAKTYITSNLPE